MLPAAVGQPPGSLEPLVSLEPQLGHSPEEVEVVLVEAKPNDPAVPQGKVLARVGGAPRRPLLCRAAAATVLAPLLLLGHAVLARCGAVPVLPGGGCCLAGAARWVLPGWPGR